MNAKNKKISIASVLALAILSTTAFGQVRQITGGRVLDANPGVGTGGSNNPIPGYVPLNQNDIISGNVAGLAYFHDRVGTVSPYVFNAPLGSSALNNFIRESAPVGNNALTNSFYLPSTVVSTASGQIYSSPYRGGFDSSLVPQSAVNPTVVASQLPISSPLAAGVPSQAFDRYSIMNTPLQAGAPGALMSSPLFTLREQPLNENVNNQPASTTQPTELIPGLPGAPTTMPSPRGALNLGAEGQQVDVRIQGLPQDVREADVGANQNVGQKAEINDTYRTLLEAIHAEESKAPPTPTPTTKPATTRPQMGIDPLTGQPRRIIPLPTGGGKEKADLPATRLEDQPTKLLQAGRDLKPLNSLANIGAGKTTPFDEVMVRAQQFMKEGKYLDAAQSYESALTLQPDNALALVGRAHAELAAGMFQSAAYDLKFLFTRKPELVSVHYEMDAFVPAGRQETLIKDLSAMATSKDSSNLASFLYCYICYQTHRDAQLQNQLDVWSNRPEKDSWQNVLTRAWTKTDKQ